MSTLPLRCFAVCVSLALPAAAQPGDENKPAPTGGTAIAPAGATGAAVPAGPNPPTPAASTTGTPPAEEPAPKPEKPKRGVETTFGVNPQEAQLGSEAGSSRSRGVGRDAGAGQMEVQFPRHTCEPPSASG